MKKKYNLAELIKLNHGDLQDTQQIIQIYKGRGLVEINNSVEHVFYSETLQPKDLRLKSRFRKVLELIKEADSAGKSLLGILGWILFLWPHLVPLIKSLSVKLGWI